MEMIRLIFGAGSSTAILLLIFFPTIAFIIQFIANIQLIKRLPKIEENLKLMNKRLFSIENFSMPQDIQCDIESEETNDEEKENNELTSIEKLERLIAAVLVCVAIIFLIITISKYKI